MIKYFTNILGIDNIPRWLLVHLMLFSFALGGVQSVLFISALSGFTFGKLLDVFPEAIALSGLFGILLFSFYKYIIKSFSYRKALAFYCIVIVFVIFLVVFLPVVVPILSSPFLLFVVFLPITLINEQFVNGISENVTFRKYQQNLKRYTEATYIAGSVVFSVGIAVAARIGIGTVVFIPIFVLFILAAFESDYILRKVELKKADDTEKIESVISMFSDIPLKFTVLLLLAYSFLSVINLVFIDFIFIDKLGQSYQNYSGIVQFLGMFSAGLMIITLLFKLFVYQNLIKTFRINKALAFSALLMVAIMFSLNVILIMPVYFNWNMQWINIFFLIVFIRFFAYLLRESFELNSMKMILSAISTYSTKQISNSIHNLFTIWGLLFSGLLLLLIMSFDLFTTRYIIYINTFFALVWVFISVWLTKKYSQTLFKIIAKLSDFSFLDSQSRKKTFKERVMLTTNLSGLKYLLNYQRYYQPFDFEKSIEGLPANMQDQLGLGKPLINPNEYSTHLHEPSKFQTGESNSLNYYDSDVSLKLTDVEALASSSKIKDRIRAVKMIENSHNFSYAGVFKMLVRDSDDEVRRNALMAVVTYYNSDILLETVKYISHEEFSILVSEVFIKIGDDAIPMLNLLFGRGDTDLNVQVQIIKIIGRIGSPSAINFLLDKLTYPNKWIINETVLALGEVNLDDDLRKSDIFTQAIFNTIGVLAWILAKDVSIDKIRKTEPLKKSLEDEFKFSLHLLFLILQIKYNSGIIGYINANYDTFKNNEQTEIQVELLSNIVDDKIKSRLFALLHNNQKLEKLEQLKLYYPVKQTSVSDAVKDLVNADYEYISTWTKACALKFYIELSDNLEAEEIIAHLFNPDMLIAELAFFTLYKKDPDVIARLSDRIPLSLRNRVVPIIKRETLNEFSLLFYKVISIQKISYFQNIMGHYLLPFAECLHELFLQKGESSFLKCSEEEILPVFFSPQGEISLIDLHKRKVRLNQNYLYGLGLYGGGININAFSGSVLYIAQPEQIGYLVIHYEELSEALFKYIQNSNFY